MDGTNPAPSGRFNAAEYFVDRNLSEGRGRSIAVFYGDFQLTYERVAELVNRAANALECAGIVRGDRVALVLLDSPAFVAAFWGALKLGAVPVPVSTLLPAEEYEFVLTDSAARGLIVDARLLDRVRPALDSRAAIRSAGQGRWGDLEFVWVASPAFGCAPVAGCGNRPGASAVLDSGIRSLDEASAASAVAAHAAPTGATDPAFWLYTSGSTGRPKAAVHLHDHLFYCARDYAGGVLGLGSDDRTFSASKLYFAYGLGNALYFPFGVGASTVLFPERPAADKIFEIVRRYRPTLFFAVPGVYTAMLQAADAQEADLSSVRAAVSAGEGLPAPLWERFRERFGISILDGIGSTEMLHMFISNRPGDVAPGSSGRLVPGYEARIVDEQGTEVAPGELGELLIRGNSRAAGYWNRPELTRATFRGEWTATGDKFRSDERGCFWHCGRTDDMLKVSGLWVSPMEIESALGSHPAVVECAVVGATDSDGLTHPKAFVVLKDSASDGPELEAELAGFLHSRLPGYKVPHWFVVIPSLPRTATGKVQRFKLRHHRKIDG